MGGMLSLEGSEGNRFLTRSRVLTENEREQLKGLEKTRAISKRE